MRDLQNASQIRTGIPPVGRLQGLNSLFPRTCPVQSIRILSMRIPSGLTREHVLAAINELDIGIPTRFGRSTRFDLLHEGRKYSPKSVLAHAIAKLTGAEPDPYAFSGGEVTNRRLTGLGFEVVRK